MAFEGGPAAVISEVFGKMWMMAQSRTDMADEAVRLRRHDGRWRRDTIAGSSVELPEGGAIVDAEARVAIAAILDRLRTGGLIEASPD